MIELHMPVACRGIGVPAGDRRLTSVEKHEVPDRRTTPDRREQD